MTNFQNNLFNKIKKRCLNIGIVGIGYVGIKLVLAYSKGKNTIYCFDNNKNKIKLLKEKKSPYSYILNKEIREKSKYLNLQNKLENIKKCDVIIFCLPTPLKNQKPDLDDLKKGWKKIKYLLKPGQLVILESTVYPGCTEEIFATDLKKKFQLDKNFFFSLFSRKRKSWR